MEKFFKKMRTEAKEFIGEGKSFSQELFRETDWYLSLKGWKEQVPLQPLKRQVLPSLKSPPPIKPSKPLQPIKELVVRSEEREVSFSWNLFLKQLDHCSTCPAPCLKARNAVVHEYSKEVGNLQVLFVSDHPREEDQEQKQALSGERRELLERIIAAMELKDTEYALSLVVKCLPGGESFLEEMGRNCFNHLKREIVTLRPKFIISLGAFATHALLEKKERLSQIHGQFFSKIFQVEGATPHSTKIVPIFHPDYLLINPSMKKSTWSDLQKVMRALEK